MSITVDVDDPTALRAAAIADDALADPLVPTLDEALGDVVVDAIADLAMPSLRDQGVHAVALDHDDSAVADGDDRAWSQRSRALGTTTERTDPQ